MLPLGWFMIGKCQAGVKDRNARPVNNHINSRQKSQISGAIQ